MKKIIKSIYLITIVLSILFMLAGCKFQENQSSLEEKINSEISYLDSEINSMVSQLNNINYDKYKVEVKEMQNNSSIKESTQSSGKSDKQDSQEKNTQGSNKEESDSSSEMFTMKPTYILGKQEQVDWEELKNKIENLYETWTTIVVDLKEIGVSNEQLSLFNSSLDMAAISIKNEDKNGSIDNLIKLYGNLPEFSKNNKSEKYSKILNSKYKLLICYKYANLEDEEQFKKTVEDLKMSFSNVQNQKNEYEGKQINIKNAAVIIDEISESTDISANKDIFFIKYKNLMQEFNIVSSF